MNKKIKQESRGFTIVEVLIVLAIAGLILAVVFFAVPQLRRAQRDNQRQSLATRLSSELDSYAGNHGGIYPFSANNASAYALCSGATTGANPCGGAQGWLTTYITNGNVNINDPSSNGPSNIYIGGVSSNTLPANGSSPGVGGGAGNLFIVVGATCVNGTLTAKVNGSATTSTYAVVANLDRNGTSYCVSSQ